MCRRHKMRVENVRYKRQFRPVRDEISTTNTFSTHIKSLTGFIIPLLLILLKIISFFKEDGVTYRYKRH
jgi:tetrahydromethanopterin S-methyltransferase subunit F